MSGSCLVLLQDCPAQDALGEVGERGVLHGVNPKSAPPDPRGSHGARRPARHCGCPGRPKAGKTDVSRLPGAPQSSWGDQQEKESPQVIRAGTGLCSRTCRDGMEGFSEEQSVSRILWGRVGVSQAEAGKEEAEAEARQQESEVGLRVAGMPSSGWDVRAVSSQAFSGFLPWISGVLVLLIITLTGMINTLGQVQSGAYLA